MPCSTIENSEKVLSKINENNSRSAGNSWSNFSVSLEEAEFLVRYNNRKSGSHDAGYWDESSNSSLLFQEKALEKIIKIYDSPNMILVSYSWYPTLISMKEVKRIMSLKSKTEESDFDIKSHIIKSITHINDDPQKLLEFAPSWEIVPERDFLNPSNLATNFIFSYIKDLDVSGIVVFALSVKRFMERKSLSPEQVGHIVRVLAYIIIGWIHHLGLEKVAELHFKEAWKKKYAESLIDDNALDYLKKLECILDAGSNQQALFCQLTVKTFEEDVNRLGEKIVRASEAMNPPLSITASRRKRKRKPQCPVLLYEGTSDETDEEDE